MVIMVYIHSHHGWGYLYPLSGVANEMCPSTDDSDKDESPYFAPRRTSETDRVHGRGEGNGSQSNEMDK